MHTGLHEYQHGEACIEAYGVVFAGEAGRRQEMVHVVIPVSSPDTPSAAQRVQVNIHAQAQVVSPELARRRANVWLLENAGNLLRAEAPELIAGEHLTWRLDVVLTSPARGVVGRVGQLEVDSATGDVLADTPLVQEIISRSVVAPCTT
jgi:hypothetical protein